MKGLHDTVRKLKIKIRTLNGLLKFLKDKTFITESSESTIKVNVEDI